MYHLLSNHTKKFRKMTKKLPKIEGRDILLDNNKTGVKHQRKVTRKRILALQSVQVINFMSPRNDVKITSIGACIKMREKSRLNQSKNCLFLGLFEDSSMPLVLSYLHPISKVNDKSFFLGVSRILLQAL